MCWSFGASALFTIIGLVVTLYLVFKKRSPFLWIPIGYFALMELIQALTYLTLNNCSSPTNQLLTFLGYIHIAFQPFFANMIMMYFIPEKVRDKIYGYVYAVCFISTIVMLTKIYPFDWAGSCVMGVEGMCGTNLCSVSGNWHLAWNIPFNGLPLSVWPYLISAFIVPLVYGAWRVVLYSALFGPILSYLLTSNVNERPAVWCLFSIAIIILALSKPMMEWLRVKKWYFWNYPKFR